MFKNLKLSSKLYLGFAVPLAILIGISAFTYSQAQSVQETAAFTQEESAVFASLAKDMKLDVVQVQQWLTDISATRAAEGLDDGFDEAASCAQSFKEGVGEFRAMYKEENDQEGLQTMAKLERAFDAYYQVGKKMAKAFIEEGTEAGNKTMGEFDGAAATMTKEIDALVEQQISELNESMGAIVDSSATLKSSVVFATLGAIILVLLLSWSIARSITKPINRVVVNLTEGSDQVTAASGQVATASQELAEGASEQASSLEETSSVLEEMAAMTRTNAENAKQANELTNRAAEAAQEGDKTMGQLNAAMTAINESSGQIGKIIKVIEGIAFQTNLLALNAAVEAARAGEHGKGFAVVADEVRNLAQRAAQAAGETTSLIDDSVTKAREGTEVAGSVGKALGAIVQDVTKAASLVNQINQASNEQAEGVNQVNTAISQMDKVTQQNAAGAEESAAAAEELSGQAEAVKGMVGDLMKVVHGAKAEMKQSVGGGSSLVAGNTVRTRLHPNVAHLKRAPKATSKTQTTHAVTQAATPPECETPGADPSASEQFLALDDKQLKNF